jgi:hypothetical protein
VRSNAGETVSYTFVLQYIQGVHCSRVGQSSRFQETVEKGCRRDVMERYDKETRPKIENKAKNV